MRDQSSSARNTGKEKKKREGNKNSIYIIYSFFKGVVAEGIVVNLKIQILIVREKYVLNLIRQDNYFSFKTFFTVFTFNFISGRSG